nr:2A [Oscivirus A1]
VVSKVVEFSDTPELLGQVRPGAAPTHLWREIWLYEGPLSFALSDGSEHIVVTNKIFPGDLDGLVRTQKVPLVKFLQLRSLIGVTLVTSRAEFLDMLLNIDGCSPQTQLGVLDFPPTGQCVGQ